MGLGPNPQMKPNAFWNKYNIAFNFISLIEHNDIIMKRKTLQYFYKLTKEKYGNRKKKFPIFFGKIPTYRRVKTKNGWR